MEDKLNMSRREKRGKSKDEEKTGRGLESQRSRGSEQSKGEIMLDAVCLFI